MKKLLIILCCISLLTISVFADDFVQYDEKYAALRSRSVEQPSFLFVESAQNEVSNELVVSDEQSIESGEQSSEVIEESTEKEEESKPVEDVSINAENVTINYNNEPEIEPYVVPDTPIHGGFYIEGNTSQLGDVKIYVPYDYAANSFSYTDNNVISVRSSTITGVLYANSGTYTVRFASYSTPEYRTYDSGYTYADLNINQVYSTNIDILSADPPKEIGINTTHIIIMMLGGILVCLFMMRS